MESGDERKYLDESVRLSTFEKWPVSFLPKERMAECGFYYTGCKDYVRCPYCHLVVFKWEPEDDPLEEHRKFSPHCVFLQDSSKFLIIEFSGAYIRHTKHFSIKEVAAIDNDGFRQHWITHQQVRCDSSECDRGEEDFYHGLGDSIGDVSKDILFDDSLKFLCRKYQFIFCKGSGKCEILQNLIGKPVWDLGNFDCPSVKELNDSKNECLSHRVYAKGMYCSLAGAIGIYNWMKASNINLKSKATREKTFKECSPQSVMSYSLSGFVKQGKNEVRCVFCGTCLPYLDSACCVGRSTLGHGNKKCNLL